jgi:predicted ATPase with chaperone activity
MGTLDMLASASSTAEDKQVDREATAQRDTDSVFTFPAAPATVEETGLSPTFLMELVLKLIHYAEIARANQISERAGLPLRLVDELLNALKERKLCELVGSPTSLTSGYRYALTDNGRLKAEEALARCRYAGAAPVTLEQYEQVVNGYALERWRPARETIQKALRSLLLDDKVADLLDRALHSGRCALIFGPSGNGKTHLLDFFVGHLDGTVLVPHALYAYGQVIRMFDATVHVPVDTQEASAPVEGDGEPALSVNGARACDKRWVSIQRPSILVGGELTADCLELGYDPITHFYQAPPHLKAQGGVLVVDDFGRQRVSPKELLNRWIMAFERQRDNLVLRTGESLDLPFHVNLLFSTNLDPASLADEAFLRRMPYKVYMPPPTLSQFREILRRACEECQVDYSEEALDQAIESIRDASNGQLRGSLARDIVSIVVDNAKHDGHAPVLTPQAVVLACEQSLAAIHQWSGSSLPHSLEQE